MKRRILATVLSLCLLLPARAGATSYSAEGEQAALSRVGFLSELAQATGADTSAYADVELPFTDCSREPSVAWAWYNWLINGDGTGACRANSLNREEAATILGRWMDNTYTELPGGCGTGAPSMDNISEWAQDGVMKCWMYGIIDMNDAADFRPKDPVTVADAKEWCGNLSKLANLPADLQANEPDFADALVRAAAPKKGNWTLSPYSARLCLAMLANGAKGETQKELLDALRIDDLALFNQIVQEQNVFYSGLERIMTMQISNSVWLNQSWFDGKGAFLPEFVKTMDTYYHATAEEVTNKDSVEQVNAWANEKTNGKIPTILTEDNREFVTALVNAVYFKAAWASEFPENRTEKADFTNADGTTGTVDMMHQTSGFGYYSTPGVEALKMDYRNYAVDNVEGDGFERFIDADLSMYLIKADDTIDVQHLLDGAEFVYGDVEVSVPKFKVEYGAALDDALKAMGVKTAYDHEEADLTAMIDPSGLPGGQHFLDTVLQKAYIAVDEKGTEAAAVTAAMDGAGAAPMDRPQLIREFTADSPFWFVIRDNNNGELFFVGRYENVE
ncbi:serpin family protein [Candidatus Agathobaculum pullicola]|uniref:serpin family protein n=1 Tax=Candidatus Agathobaculum pullicola TaxID=2838426 RepID=UPI003F90924C